MTMAPSRELGVRFSVPDQQEWVEPDVDLYCCHPHCLRKANKGWHHIEPRSRTGGPRDWVVIDGVVVWNKCRLCWKHHRQVTGDVGGHRARIVWVRGQWVWELLGGIGGCVVGPLRGSWNDAPE